MVGEGLVQGGERDIRQGGGKAQGRLIYRRIKVVHPAS